MTPLQHTVHASNRDANRRNQLVVLGAVFALHCVRAIRAMSELAAKPVFSEAFLVELQRQRLAACLEDSISFSDAELLSLARDEDAFSDEEEGGNRDMDGDVIESVFTGGADGMIDDVKGRSALELQHARNSLLDDDSLVEAASESKLPPGAEYKYHLEIKLIEFAKPLPVYRFTTTEPFRRSLLQRSDSGALEFTDDAAQRLIAFLFDQHPKFPVQIALSCCNSFVMTGSSVRSGQVWIANKEFVCAGIKHNCSTKLTAGFTVDQPEVCCSLSPTSCASHSLIVLVCFASFKQELTVTFHTPEKPCVHVFGAEYGQTRGSIRKALVDSGSRPYSLTKSAMESLTADRVFSGNRVGVPTPRAARAISGQASRAGQLHKDLGFSLTMLSTYYENEDRKRPASEQLLDRRQRRSVFGLVFAVQTKPINIVLTTEGAVRIYLKMLDTEPGFWADYTGNLCKNVGRDAFASSFCGCCVSISVLCRSGVVFSDREAQDAAKFHDGARRRGPRAYRCRDHHLRPIRHQPAPAAPGIRRHLRARGGLAGRQAATSYNRLRSEHLARHVQVAQRRGCPHGEWGNWSCLASS